MTIKGKQNLGEYLKACRTHYGSEAFSAILDYLSLRYELKKELMVLTSSSESFQELRGAALELKEVINALTMPISDRENDSPANGKNHKNTKDVGGY